VLAFNIIATTGAKSDVFVWVRGKYLIIAGDVGRVIIAVYAVISLLA